MNSFEFELKTKTKFGAGEFKKLDGYLNELGILKGLIVVDKNVLKTSYVKNIIDGFKGKSISHYDVIEYNFGEPTYDLLEKYRFEIPYECVIGIGGGSVLDFAKGLAFLATNKNDAVSYKGFPKNINKPIPVIAIPTTAGTGSEVTYNAVFLDSSRKRKLGINTKLNFPVLAILDPKLLESCPMPVMISSGMDVLTHAVESYGAQQSNYLTRLLSEKSMLIAINNLEKAIKTKNIFYISNMMLAAYVAGIALMNSGSGPAGALSYILGPQFDIPHGLAGAVFLPHIIKHNEKKGFEYPIKNLSSKVFALCKLLYIDCYNIRKYGVKKASNLRVLAEGIETLQPAFNQNPVKFTVEDAKKIIKEMI